MFVMIMPWWFERVLKCNEDLLPFTTRSACFVWNICLLTLQTKSKLVQPYQFNLFQARATFIKHDKNGELIKSKYLKYNSCITMEFKL